MNPIILIIPFVIAAILAGAAKKEKAVKRSSLFFSALGSTLAIFYAVPFMWSHQNPYAGTWLQMDSFSALMTVLIACVYMLSIIVSVRYIEHEYKEKIITLSQYKMYFSLFHLFASCMLLTVMANNTLLLWLALEGTTLASTFLVGLYRKKTSMEAAWKYMIICSTGISLGLVGILLLCYGAHVGGGMENDIFLLNHLAARAHLVPQNIIKLAFIFIFIGFGAKVGLVPMHTWLPDAHSKAPSPVSAIFSAVLLNVALYAILRFKFIVDSALMDPAWTNRLFLIFGILSIILPAILMLIQSNYKRMLAYSSIEHMGIILFATGLSPLAATAGVMHMIGHTLTKSSLFFGAGEILIHYKTTKVSKIGNMFREAKYTSILFILGIVAIVAIPPSALFVSEYGMFAQMIVSYPALAILLFIALGIIAYAMLALTVKMIFTATEVNGNSPKKEITRERWNVTHTIMTIELVTVSILAWLFTTPQALGIIANITETFIY